jgi:hypothetical protein
MQYQSSTNRSTQLPTDLLMQTTAVPTMASMRRLQLLVLAVL